MNRNNRDNLAMIRFISDEGIDKIHESTLTALDEIGIKILHEGGLALLADAGAKVDHKTKIVKISPDLVEKCLATVPSQFLMAGREEKNDIFLEAGKVYGRNGGGPGSIVDIDSGEVRYVTEKDVRDYAKLVDAMDHIEIVAPVYAHEMAGNTRDIRVLKALFESTSKHINMRLLNMHSLPYVMRMAEAVAGSKEALRQRPVITMLESPIAPLKIPDVLVETLLACGEYGVPLEICSMPITGATGPITLAGSLLMNNIETVTSMVISQLAHPGAPLIYTPRIMVMDMTTGYSLTGSMENAMLAAAAVQLAREAYNMPVNMHGPYTDSQTSDAQAGIENTYFTILSGLAGANILTGAGHLAGGLIISFAQLLMDNELMGIAKRSMEEFVVNDETLGLDAIARSISTDNLLSDKHTRKHLRSSNRYFPKLLTREARDKWKSLGSLTMADRATIAARELLESHQVTPLSGEISKALEEIVAEASAKLD
ncbi:MAG: trimethylamine methyltransferase family protein [Deltaproteobacteria bacterium]|nr:trimethylamine methyltransferase family protein [Deltaproteobacteria bacterium]